LLAAASLLFATVAASAPTVSAGPSNNGCEKRRNESVDKLLECVRAENVMEHLNDLQAIADANNGTRASGTPGYDASVDYVVEQMTNAGYVVTTQSFPFAFYRELAPATLSSGGASLTTSTLTYSGNGSLSNVAVTPVDVVIPFGATPNTSNSGCEAADVTACCREPSVRHPPV
jgi:hypothetical protein